MGLVDDVKIAVVGSRKYHSEARVRLFVRSLPEEWEVVSGGCAGVDTWAQEEAEEQHRNYTVFYADWDRVGKAAGVLRNSEIAGYCDAAVGFVEGDSSGTMDTVRKVVALRKPVWMVDAEGDVPGWEEILAKIERTRT